MVDCCRVKLALGWLYPKKLFDYSEIGWNGHLGFLVCHRFFLVGRWVSFIYVIESAVQGSLQHERD